MRLVAVFRFAEDASLLISGHQVTLRCCGVGWTAYDVGMMGLTAVLAAQDGSWSQLGRWVVECGRCRVDRASGLMVGDIVPGGDRSGPLWSTVDARRREWDERHAEHRTKYRAGAKIARSEMTVADPPVSEREGIVWLRSVVGYGEGPVDGIGAVAPGVSLWLSVLLREVERGLAELEPIAHERR